MIEITGLPDFLMADPTVSGIVSERVYKRVLPKGYKLPAIVMTKVAADADQVSSLQGDNPTEIRRFQFDCFAPDPDTASTLSRAVKSLLVPKSDGSGSTTDVAYDLPDGTHVQSARLHMDNDLGYEEGSGGYIHRNLLDIEFSYTNPS